MKKIIISAALIVIIVSNLVACQSIDDEKAIMNWTKYNCDVKHLNFVTTIHIYKSEELIYKISGEEYLFKSIYDPLKMYTSDGTLIASAGDEYHFISQDSHAIFDAENTPQIEMVGEFNIWGESYVLYDKEHNKIGYFIVGGTNTSGKITDEDGNVVVKYTSSPLFDDYELYISPECKISDEYAILIFASYFSDFAADDK